MSKNFQRNSNSDDGKSDHGDNVQQEVSKFIKSGKNDSSVLNKLKGKYGDNADMIDKVYDAFKEEKERLMNVANKFKALILGRYGNQNLPFSDLMKKARKYAVKYNIGDEAFQYFFNMAISDVGDVNQLYNIPNTMMRKTFGYGPTMFTSDKLIVIENELAIVNDIIRLHGETKALHSQIILQTLNYKDCAPEALTGSLKYKSNGAAENLATDKHNFYSFVHPVIAALFLPQIKLLDEQMLIANLGYIVKCKYEGTQIVTKPDFELYWRLITDPNDNACSFDSAILDLSNRFKLQTYIWDSVLNLRQGRYYNDKLADFLLAIENCRNNVYDAPDLTYVKDEGSILRKILSAFSLRPTIVSTSRLYPSSGLAYGNVPQGHLSSFGITQVTTVPIISLRLPLRINGNTPARSLEEALTQPQWFVENKMIIPKAQNIIYSDAVIFFYVGRRFQTVNVARFAHPYNFSNLPMTIAGWEALNDHVVNYEPVMNILNDVYHLRSVVFVDTSESKKGLIIGCSAGIVVPTGAIGLRNMYVLYDPQGSASMFENQAHQLVRNDPITEIPGEAPLNDGPESVKSFWTRASTRGTIFVYQRVPGVGGDNPFTKY